MPARTTGRTGLITEDKIYNAAWPLLSLVEENERWGLTPHASRLTYTDTNQGEGLPYRKRTKIMEMMTSIIRNSERVLNLSATRLYFDF